jgi:hypothetical protein
MRIIDSRNHQASRQVDSPCRRARFGRNLLTCADAKYLGSFDRKCFRVGMRLAAGEHATVHQDRVWGAVRVCTCAPEGDADNVIMKTSRARLHDIVGFSPQGESYNTQTRAEFRRHTGLRPIAGKMETGKIDRE